MLVVLIYQQQFMEAELDYFGAHSYDLKSEHAMDIKKGTTSL